MTIGSRRTPDPDPSPPTSTTPTHRASDHAGAFRLRQDRRRLRLHLRVLHHSDPARVLPQPDGRLHRPGGTGARGAGRAGAPADLSGHDVLRHRPRRARGARAAAAGAERDRRAPVDSASLPLPDDHHRRRARRDGRLRESLPVRRPAAPARRGPGPQADAPSRQPAHLRRAARPYPAARAGRHPPDDPHRRLSGRNR